jgi:pilus assembly protein CpaB
MGKYKPFILLGAAVIVALITSVLIYNSLQEKGKGKDLASLATEPVAVAVADMAWGTEVQKEMIQMVPFLKESLPEGSFSDFSSLVGRVLIYPVKAKEPILEARLAPISIKTGGVAAVISPKKRAIAVRVDRTIGVSGFIRPGNRVDVLVTLSNGKTSAPVTKTVLENVLVRTVGAEIEKKGREEKPSDVDVITLEVTPEEAEKVALSATEGKLQLTLRNYNDTEDVLTKGTTIPTLLASYNGQSKTITRKVVERKKSVSPVPLEKVEMKVGSAPLAPEKKPVFVVALIKGNNISEVKFEGGEGR